MIKQQNAGALRSSRRRARTGRAALMLSAGTLALVLAQPALAQVAPGALPTGGNIVGGTGSIGTVGDDMTVTQTSDRLLINWGSFDIGEDASVHFDMDASDIAVNRDLGGDPSQIYGALSGDGMIMILNPNGVLFGAGANVNVGSLVATTAGLTDLNALSGSVLDFSGVGGGAINIAAGANITVAEAGLAAFVAPSVTNNGIITATAGHVLLGGANGFTLDLANDGLLELTVPTASPLVQNHGSIFAAGGRIQMSAAAASALVGTVINTSGVLSVASASSDDGVIVLEAAGNAIEVSGDLSAEGDIEFSARRVHGGGDVDVADGALTLNIDPSGADTTGETLIADALGVIGAVADGTTLNLAAGDYAAGATINTANVTVDGGGVARIIADQHGQDGLIVNGTGDGAVIQGLNFIGQADTSYNGFAWGGTITRGVVLRNGAQNVTVTDNVITGVRNGILIDGRNDGSVITDNVIDNTKSAISVQYTDGSTLTLTGNAEGVFGNEWGINLHLNGVWNGAAITPSAGSLGANPSAAAQQHLLDLSNANSGMSVYNQAYSASNRTHVYVDAGGSPTGQGAAPTPISTVHGGVAAVVSGGQVFVADGLYNFAGSRLVIDKSLTLTGESEEGVILDGRSVGGGLGTVLVSADNVTLSNFTLYGADSGVNNYGIKVQPNPTGYDPNQRLYNFSINDVTVRGSTRAELDLNGVVGATITNFTADGRRVGDDSHESGGAGVQITDSADITLTGVTTLGNAWGSVAIYQSNVAGAYNGLTTNINIDAGENTFNEFLGVFVQSYSTLHPEIGQLNLTGFDHAVRNTGHRANGGQFTFFRTDLNDAINFALNIGAANTSSIEGWSGTDYTNSFTVVDGLTIGAALRDADDGAMITVGAGEYVENISITQSGLTLVSTDGRDVTTIRGVSGVGANQTVTIAADGVTLGATDQGFTIVGFDNGNPGIENGAIYIQGANAGSTIQGNRITADGDLGLFSQWGAALTGLTVQGNIFDGVTYQGVAPATGNQFTTPNVSRQLVALGGGSGSSDVVFADNQVIGDSGLNTAVTIDSSDLTVTGNTFASTTGGWGAMFRARGTGVDISGNAFDTTGLANTAAVLTLGVATADAAAFEAILADNGLTMNGAWADAVTGSTRSLHAGLRGAINEAASGATVNVLAGEYVEADQVLIDDDLSIVGHGDVVIKAGRNFTGSAPGQAWWLVEEGVTFGLSGVTLDGAGFNVAYGLRNHGHTTIDEVTFRNIVSSGYSGVAVASFGGDVAGGGGAGSWADSSLIITDSVFENIGRIGVLVKGDGATARIEDSVFTGRGEGDHVEYAVEAGASGAIEVIGNTITNYRGVAASDGSASSGILVTSYYGGASNAVIENNIITGNTSAVSVGYGGTDVSVVEAFNNDLSGNDFGVSLNSAASADFSGNWWGFTADGDVAAYMGGAQADRTDFSTYLTSGADTGADAGFQGDFSVVAVTALGGQTGTGGRIQEGVNLVDTGGVVRVGAGDFDDRTIVLNRSVTLQGAQGGQAAASGDGEAGTGDRGDETVLTGSGPYVFNVAAQDVTIDGFTFTGAGGRLIITSGTANRLSILNNIFDTPSGHAGNGLITLTGTANDVLIANNLFAGDGGAGYLWASGGAGDGLSGLTVRDNDFSGVSERGIFQGGQQFSGFELSGNYFGSGILTGVNMGHLINPLIQGNHFDGVGYAAMQIGVIGGGTIRNNLVDGTGVTGYDFGAYNAAYGIQIWGGAYGTPSSEGLVIEGNTVLNYVGTGADDRFVGIYIGADAGPDIQVTGNTLTGNSIGLWSASAVPGLNLTGNTFTVAAGGLAIRNTGSASIELMGGGNLIDGVNTDAASLEELFGIEDLIDHGMDQTGYGLVRVIDGHLFVTQDSGSIQRAVDLSGAGDTVNVGAGTFGGFATAFGGPADLTIHTADGAVIDGTGVTGRIIDLRADGTTVSGFTIVGDGGGVGFSVSGRGVSIIGNTIDNVLTGVQTTTHYVEGDVLIADNVITAAHGVSLQNTGNQISGNTVTASVEGVGLLHSANTFVNNTFNMAAGADALNYYGSATFAGLTAMSNTVSIEGGGLQGALDLAGLNGSVDAGAATYDETVTIRHGLTLTGAGEGDTVINGGVVIAGHAPAGSFIDGLTIEGLTINAGVGQVGLIALSNSVDGVYNTRNLSLTDVTINMNGQHAVGLFDVDGAVFTDVTISGDGSSNAIEAVGLNDFTMTGGAISNARVGLNLFDVAGYEANGGLGLVGVAFSDNLVHVNLAGLGADLEGLLDANSFDRTVHATDGEAIYGDLAFAVGDAAAGSELNLSADTFTLTSSLVIDRALTLVGAGQGLTIIDASGAATYGIRVHADDVSLSDFTLSGGSGYGVKVEAAGSPTPDQRRTGFSIADVTIENTGRTGLDLNAVIGAMIDGVTVTGVGNGNGISITDSADVTVRNTTTSGNAWGGLALYQRNNIGGGGSDQQLTDIVIEDSNDFGEATGVYVQVYNSALHEVGNLTVAGFDFAVQNDALDGGVSSYVFFDRTLQDAIDRGVNLFNASESVVGGWTGSGSDGNLYVGFGELIGGGQGALSIQTAFDASGDGDTIHIAGGDYGQSATLDEARSVLFDETGVGMVDLTFAAGAAGSGVSGRVDATGDIVFDGGVILLDGLNLTAETVSLAGVEGSSVNGQTLTVQADAVSIGSAGAVTALRNLMLFGDTTLTGSTYSAFGFSVSGAATLAEDVSITVTGPLVLGAVDGAHGLTITAGGPATLGEVGAIEALTGLDVTASTISTSGATTSGAQSYTGALTLDGDYAAGGAFSVNDATTLGGATSVDAASITMTSVDGGEDLTLAADGAVVLGAVGSSDALASLTATGASISTAGAATTGGQSYTGATTLGGDYAAGGSFSVNGATTLGGATSVDAASINLASVDGEEDLVLAADGAVVLGAAGSAEALASLTATGASITTAGAATTGAQSYAGALTLDGDYAAGGLFSVNGATTLGGATSVDAASINLAAVDGEEDLVLAADGAVVLGAVGSTEALASLTASGASITTAGAATTGGQSYAGATALSGDYAAGGAFSVNGATTLGGDVEIVTEGGPVLLAMVDGAHGLTISAGVGDVVLGPVGSIIAVDDLIVSGGVVTSAGAVSTGSQSWSGVQVRLSGAYATGGGDFAALGPVILNGATTIATAGGDASLDAVDGASAGGQSFSLNAGAGSIELGSLGALARLGAVVIRANNTVLNGDTYAANSLSFMGAGADATVRLTELLTTFNTVQSADQAGAIFIAPHLIGTADGQQGVVFLAGTGGSAGDGDITLTDAGTEGLRLGLMTATGGDFSAETVMLAGDFTSTLSGDQVFSDDTLDTLGDVNAVVAGDERGPINAGGSVTLNVGGSSTGSIVAGGPVSVTSGGDTSRVITSGGAVVLTSTGGSVGGSVQASGPVTINSAGTITGSYAAGGDIILNAGQPIDVQVNGGVIQVNAPGGVVGGVFNQITTDARGTFVINGEAVIGTGSADARQVLVDGFIAPVGGVVGPTGLIQLPVGLALALVSPAGDGEGQRPAVLVNDVDRLGELLRLGYTAIVIQIDESGLLIEEELILADTEQQQAAGLH